MKLQNSKGEIISLNDFTISDRRQIVKIESVPDMVVRLFANEMIYGFQCGFANTFESGLNLEPDKKVQRKIEFLINNNPFNDTQENIKNSISWPVDFLYNGDSKYCVGYLSSFTENKLPLIYSTKALSGFNLFDIKSPKEVLLRYKICQNIARLVAHFHALGNYTFINLTMDDFLFGPDGSVFYTNIENCQIANKNVTIHEKGSHDTEYCPPGFYYGGLTWSEKIYQQTWDLYALGILFYYIMTGIHPFDGLIFKVYHKHSIEACINSGYFPHNPDNISIIRESQHDYFYELLSKDLQQLFLKVFVDGHSKPEARPSAATWQKAFESEIQLFSN